MNYAEIPQVPVKRSKYNRLTWHSHLQVVQRNGRTDDRNSNGRLAQTRAIFCCHSKTPPILASELLQEVYPVEIELIENDRQEMGSSMEWDSPVRNMHLHIHTHNITQTVHFHT